MRPDLFTDDRRLYLVVEKILGLDEWLPDWPVEGTTGYDFLVTRERAVRRRPQRARRRRRVYEQFTRLRDAVSAKSPIAASS